MGGQLLGTGGRLGSSGSSGRRKGGYLEGRRSVRATGTDRRTRISVIDTNVSRQLNGREHHAGGGWRQRAEKATIEHARSNYMLDTNAVCDGSSCAVPRPADGAARATPRPTSNQEPLVLTGSTNSPDVPVTTATSFIPPPFTIILGLHHKCVSVERKLGWPVGALGGRLRVEYRS